jgi:hypothetical protein
VTPAQLERLKAFHTAQGHPGPVRACADCAAQVRQQAADRKALRAARAHNAARAMDPKRRIP